MIHACACEAPSASSSTCGIQDSGSCVQRASSIASAVLQVKNMLFGQVTKTTSGFISRHINARLSIPTSKLLVETGLSPHAITVLLVLTTGLYSAYLVSIARDYSTLLIGGILWQLAAVFDRCDGEVARFKLCESKFGSIGRASFRVRL